MLLGVLVTLGAMELAFVHAFQPAAAPSPVTTTVTVWAERGWQPGGVAVQRGEWFTITYLGGEWSQCGGYGGEACRYTDADGLDFESPHDNVMKSGCADARLIARIGGEPPFCVGGHFSGQAVRSGALELRINDTMLGDNDGQILLQITRGATPRP